MSARPPEATDSRRLRAVLTFVATVAFVVAPFAVPGFDGYAPEAFPVPQLDPPVQPAGYAFGIWGLIYLWLLVHAGFGLFARADDADWDAPRWPLFASLALGASWLAVAKAAPLAATVQIWLMLAAALLAVMRTAPGRERWLLTAPLALYAGWLTAASWVAVGLVLAGYGLVSETVAAVLALAGAVAVAVRVQARLPHAPDYGVAVIWALVGVIVANLPGAPGLAALAALGVAAMAVAILRARRG